ncbi:membrane-bound PQQ-dependent dehydrogenase, glucose/quinate/shikimate family [Pantoea cypripedii]|uniref:Membrane-bound PQQ-dependent dehydrogenase, glucose/quinate/shikimate family n=1 Tax=Pantoea cypripedii TaxID=55209 RepID=A0A6B9GGP2_PANCY|nr:membrane-bound PQQ-dependent dehydrogenase, glucose/quinate/shikimate family [Pantoea cypripedii]QGY32745.1 membrane-bound PQQ-dependent dehydrogenase, glucose/quinate/shikimate family [Pantoea cypripedii]
MRKMGWLPPLIGVLIALAGLVLGAGGGYLAILGGSWFYLFTGIIWLLTGWTLVRRQFIAWPLTLAMTLVGVIWALWETGTDFWQFLPRVIIFVVFGVLVSVCVPHLHRKDGSQPVSATAPFAVAGVYAVSFVALIAGMFVPHAEVEVSGESAKVIHPEAGKADGKDWPAWGRNLGGDKYAQFDQINKTNVKDLKLAWTYRTGDLAIDGSEYQVTPLKIEDTMYLCTPLNKVIALDPTTGKERWRFDPNMKETASNKGWKRCRGVSYADLSAMPAPTPDAAPLATCRKRIVSNTNDGRLFELDAETGKLCEDFGDKGYVDLTADIGSSPEEGSYYLTSAPLVADGVIMVGGKLNDNMSTGEPSGVVRGFDVRSGKLLWAFDPARPDDSTPLPPGQHYAPESPNFWGTASYDPKLGLAYFPTGNQTPDFWNGNRHPYSDEFNDSIVAIELKTGKLRWHFRTANNDQFDYDVSSQPILYDLPNKDGSTTPVVIQLTKRGQVFVLDRRDGKPVAPVEYRKVPTDVMPGMKAAATQPYSAISVGVEPLKEADTWGATLFDQLYCRIEFKKMRWEGEWTPLSDKQRTLIWPGYYGGFNWGGGALDAATGTLLVNDIRMAMWGQFIKREEAAHHGLVPSTEGEYSEQKGTPWGVERSMFLSPLGTPCFKPPFGSMTAIDLASGKTKWQVPMGSIQDAPIHGIFPGEGVVPHVYIPIGMPTLGGPLVTGGGLIFFHGTLDYYIRALDNDTGKELWSSRLPVGGQGVPMTYIGKDGKQYVVVVDGGATRTGTNKNRGDYVMAYALP